MQWLTQPCLSPDTDFINAATERQAQLTKPPAALGELETLAIRLAGLQRRVQPSVAKVHISVFAADHGVADEGVSAFPQAVTTQMVHNFLQGGAAISVLAKQLGATLEIIDVGIKTPLAHPQLIVQRAGNGTANNALGAAMTSEQLQSALQAGFDAVKRAQQAEPPARGPAQCQWCMCRIRMSAKALARRAGKSTRPSRP